MSGSSFKSPDRQGDLTSGGTRSPVYGWQRFARKYIRGQHRNWMLVSLLSFWLALMCIVFPAVAHADANNLGAYSGTASGFGMQPFAQNEAFQNLPILDQQAPYAFVSMDNTPKADAKASFFTPGSAINTLPNAEGVSFSVPNGTEAQYPGNGASSSQLGGFSDRIASQGGIGAEQAQASEGFAVAQAAEGGYQFMPIVPGLPSSPPSLPSLVNIPGAPSLPTGGVPTISTGQPSGGGSSITPVSGSSPTPTVPANPASTPAPTPTKCLIICLGSAGKAVSAAQYRVQTPAGLLPIALPDPIETALDTQLQSLLATNPTLAGLAGTILPKYDPTLPYAAGDMSAQALMRVTNDGATVYVVTRASHVELLQGLIKFGSIETDLTAHAPPSDRYSTKQLGTGSIKTTVGGACSIGGIPVTFGPNGLQVLDQNVGAAQAQQLTSQLINGLAKAGITMTLSPATTFADYGYWEGHSSGVQITGQIPGGALPPLPLPTGIPKPPVTGFSPTDIMFTFASADAAISAKPPFDDGSGSTGSDNGGGFDSGGGGFFGFGGSTSGSGSSAPSSGHSGFGSFLIPGGLRGPSLLAFVFVIQGLSTAAVAATAGYSDLKEKASAALSVGEEETQ